MPKGGQNLQKCRQTCFPIQVGTRFICAEESAAPKSHKAQILLGTAWEDELIGLKYGMSMSTFEF